VFDIKPNIIGVGGVTLMRWR